MTRTIALIFICAAFGTAAFCESGGNLPEFDVADVHVSPPTANPFVNGGSLSGGRYQLRQATMVDLIHTAYGVEQEKVVGGPSWLEMDRFDVIAKGPVNATPEAKLLMLQALLADRFSLVVRKDSVPAPAFALTAGKKPNLKETEGSGDTGCKLEVLNNNNGGGRGGLPTDTPPPPITFVHTCHSMTMAAFAQGMRDMAATDQYLGTAPVVDRTELKGDWDFTFRYTLKRGGGTVAPADAITLFDAMEKQLGLRLDTVKVPLPVIIVDSVNQKPTENSPDALKAFPHAPLEFEVAGIKPSAADTAGPRFQALPGGRINIQGATLKFLLEQIWNLTDDMVIGAPKSMDSDRYDIVARAPDIGAGAGQNISVDFDALLAMVEKLLEDRFQLKVHQEERPLSAFTLTALKPKMKKADPASRTHCIEGPPEGSKNDTRDANPILGRLMTCQNTTMAQFAAQLQNLAPGYVHSPVLDSTGLEGGWDFTLSFSTAGQLQNGGGRGDGGSATGSDPSGAVSLPGAVEKQLGLKMTEQKRPVTVLVIDHVEAKPTDN